jgi:hypothetical protein
MGKPVEGALVAGMAGAYRETLALLDRSGRAIADVLERLPGLADAPIRVCLRGTDEYVRARAEPVWPPLLDAESEQLARGDIPYFFRLYGRRGIHYYADPSLSRLGTLPARGDVPQLAPLLSIARGLRAPSRKSLAEQGLFTVLGAFDHAGLTGRHEDEGSGLAVTFRRRSVVVQLPDGGELETKRDMRAFVGSVYLPCRCGEVRSVFVPPVTTCDAANEAAR